VGGKIRRQASQPGLQQREDRIDDRHDSSPLPRTRPRAPRRPVSRPPGAADRLGRLHPPCPITVTGDSQPGRERSPVYSHNRIYCIPHSEAVNSLLGKELSPAEERRTAALRDRAGLTSAARRASGTVILGDSALPEMGKKRGDGISSEHDSTRRTRHALAGVAPRSDAHPRKGSTRPDALAPEPARQNKRLGSGAGRPDPDWRNLAKGSGARTRRRDAVALGGEVYGD